MFIRLPLDNAEYAPESIIVSRSVPFHWAASDLGTGGSHWPLFHSALRTHSLCFPSHESSCVNIRVSSRSGNSRYSFFSWSSPLGQPARYAKTALPNRPFAAFVASMNLAAARSCFHSAGGASGRTFAVGIGVDDASTPMVSVSTLSTIGSFGLTPSFLATSRRAASRSTSSRGFKLTTSGEVGVDLPLLDQPRQRALLAGPPVDVRERLKRASVGWQNPLVGGIFDLVATGDRHPRLGLVDAE